MVRNVSNIPVETEAMLQRSTKEEMTLTVLLDLMRLSVWRRCYVATRDWVTALLSDFTRKNFEALKPRVNLCRPKFGL